MNREIAQSVRRNIAVVGCGYWGKNLVRNFAEIGALNTICDSNPETLNEMAGLYPGVKTETSFQGVLADGEIQGVVIASPAVLHHVQAKQALEAGKDVFVEKPLALAVNEGQELPELAGRLGKILMVGHVLEYHPAVVKLKQMIDSGEVGRVNYIYSSRLNLGRFRTDENILWSFAPHDIAVILSLLGEMPSQVAAHGSGYLNTSVADVTVTHMSFRSGVKAHIFVSWLHPFKEQKLVIVGDRHMVVFDDVAKEDKLLLYGHEIEWIDRRPVPRRAEARPISVDTAEPLRLECLHFLECLVSRGKPRTDGESAMRVLRVLEASHRSLQEQGAVISLRGKDHFVHPTAVVDQPATIGDGTRIWHFSHLMPHVTLGKNCNIGQNVFIGENVRIGNNVKIQNNVSVFEGVTLEDDVFCGPSSVFTNVMSPRSHVSQRGRYAPTTVKKGATIGANATIVCGHTIGRYAFVGAGAVVTRDIPDHALVYGNPARLGGWVCRCGSRLSIGSDSRSKCSACGEEYVRAETAGETRLEGVGR